MLTEPRQARRRLRHQQINSNRIPICNSVGADSQAAAETTRRPTEEIEVLFSQDAVLSNIAIALKAHQIKCLAFWLRTDGCRRSTDLLIPQVVAECAVAAVSDPDLFSSALPTFARSMELCW